MRKRINSRLYKMAKENNISYKECRREYDNVLRASSKAEGKEDMRGCSLVISNWVKEFKSSKNK